VPAFVAHFKDKFFVDAISATGAYGRVQSVDNRMMKRAAWFSVRGQVCVGLHLHLDVLSEPLLHSHGHPLLLLLDQLLLLEQLLLLDQLLLLLLDQLLFGMPPLLNFF